MQSFPKRERKHNSRLHILNKPSRTFYHVRSRAQEVHSAKSSAKPVVHQYQTSSKRGKLMYKKETKCLHERKRMKKA
jgi:hypothetical protein